MITSDEQVTSLLPQLEAAQWIALDTEADSLYAYPERLCLIQLSFSGHDIVIDPFALADLGRLLALLAKRELIVHGADFDLRLLHKTQGFIPERIFDTLIAARLVGETRFSLAALVEKYLGIKLSKGLRKANWAKRPLSQSLLEYATNDTKYLHPLTSILREQLDAKGRLSWHEQSCARLIHECSQTKIVDEQRVWRLRGADRLDRRGLAVLRSLWHWREEQALRANRPPYFVVSHEKLVYLAEKAQTCNAYNLPIPKKMSAVRVHSMRVAVSDAISSPRKSWPVQMQHLERVRPQSRKCDTQELKKKRDQIAAELNIDPTLIASRIQLEKLVFNWQEGAAELMPWQRELLEE